MKSGKIERPVPGAFDGAEVRHLKAPALTASTGLSRRNFLRNALWLTPLAGMADAAVIEPSWLSVRTLRRSDTPPRHRFVHFTDVHYKGDPKPLRAVVNRINELKPDFACFTGDLIEHARHLPDAVDVLRGLKVPLYAVPGNHDLRSRARLELLEEVCVATGGAWLPNRQVSLADGAVELIGIERLPVKFQIRPDAFNLLLVHYPAWSRQLRGQQCDLILAGHTHGGQVRVPFYGSLITPSHTDGYDLGHFDTPGGPLYVNPGIGTLGNFEFRFNCRPELTVFEV